VVVNFFIEVREAKTVIPKLGTVEYLPIREVWPSEATSFTPWLLENEGLLGDLLGIDISLTRNEEKVGDFSLDLLGENLTNGTTLIVENQLERTDHSHLGQLLTYAGGLEPSTIVWIASDFRDEHRAALDWLNEVTDETTHFFAVVIKAIKIGNSLPAPWLELVAQPNSWSELSRRAAHSSEVSEAQLRYESFWNGFLSKFRPHHEIYQRKRAPRRQYLTLASGVTGIVIGANVQKDRVYVDLYFSDSNAEVNKARLEHLAARKDQVESVFGHELSWEDLVNRVACRIGFYGDGGLNDESAWESSQEWLHETVMSFVRVTEMPDFAALRTIS
jgi:hypothetical protein